MKVFSMVCLLFAVIVGILYNQQLAVSACKPKGKSSKVTIGTDTYICVYLGPLNWNTTGEYLQVSSTVTADKLSRIRIPRSWTAIDYRNDTLMQKLGVTDQDTPGSGIGVTVGSMGILSYQRVYREVYSPRTDAPSFRPTFAPTGTPEPTSQPSRQPSSQPSSSPTTQPSSSPTSAPTPIPTKSPTAAPTFSPSAAPTTIAPSAEPTTSLPSVIPTIEPSATPTTSPSFTPSSNPTTLSPSFEPTLEPTVSPSVAPTADPTTAPTFDPSATPTLEPTPNPTVEPTANPSFVPSEAPTEAPTEGPTDAPTPVRRRLMSETESDVSLQYNGDISLAVTDDDFVPRSNSSITFPILFALVVVDNGHVKSIVWDNMCHWCSAGKCLPNTVDYNNEPVDGDANNCFVQDQECRYKTANVTSNSLCELTVYISWTGTDSTGANFVSGASRFSRWSTDQMVSFTDTLKHEAGYTIEPRNSNSTVPTNTTRF